nr:hypothetical protein JVH1_4185 [Rhodococcus sp. JVH1]
MRYRPPVLTADKLTSYQIAHREFMPSEEHRGPKCGGSNPQRIRTGSYPRSASYPRTFDRAGTGLANDYRQVMADLRGLT